MNSGRQPLQENTREQNPANREGANEDTQDVQISLPQIDRPDGPFEHSGETSNWTAEEKEEKEMREEQ